MLKRARTYVFCAISLLLVSLLFTSCRGDGILSSRKMVDVLTDLHRMDGMLQLKGHRYVNESDEAAYYDAVLAKHGVTRANFDSSLVWYTDHPQRFNKLYPRVLKRLETEHALFVDESEQQNAILAEREEHFRLFTYERVVKSILHGYQPEDYRLPPIDTLDVDIPLLIRKEVDDE